MTWGNVEAVKQMLFPIAHRQGCGDLLAEGIMRASQKIGGDASNCAIYTLKGNTPRGHDHRTRWKEMFDTATSGTGTLKTWMIAPPVPELTVPVTPMWFQRIQRRPKGVCFSRIHLSSVSSILVPIWHCWWRR
jgi:aldehyde:ferredoxin oxidoreductase